MPNFLILSHYYTSLMAYFTFSDYPLKEASGTLLSDNLEQDSGTRSLLWTCPSKFKQSRPVNLPEKDLIFKNQANMDGISISVKRLEGRKASERAAVICKKRE